jgi:hypothetical protein
MSSRAAVFASFVSFALAAAGCAPGGGAEEPAEPETATQDESDLRDGSVADGEHPEVGILRFDGGYCTATLIGKRTVLTAAHCFDFGSGIADLSQPALGSFVFATKKGAGRSIGFHRYRADARIWQIGFDIGVAQLDEAVAEDEATPAVIAENWPENGDTLTVYGYGRHGSSCKESDEGPKHKRKDEIVVPDGFFRRVSCPGDSGGPYFWTGSNEIVALVKGDGLGVEWIANAVKHREWILEQQEASERGELELE